MRSDPGLRERAVRGFSKGWKKSLFIFPTLGKSTRNQKNADVYTGDKRLRTLSLVVLNLMFRDVLGGP